MCGPPAVCRDYARQGHGQQGRQKVTPLFIVCVAMGPEAGGGLHLSTSRQGLGSVRTGHRSAGWLARRESGRQHED